MAHPPQSRTLADLIGANGDGIKELFHLGQPRRAGDHRPNPVPGQPVGFRERVKLDQRIGPIRIGEQVMRRAGPAVKVAVGFIDDQGNAAGAGQIAECGQGSARIFYPARIIR